MKKMLLNMFRLFVAALLCFPYLVSCQQPGNTTLRSPGKENSKLWCVDWSPDDKYVALGGDDSVLYILEANQWTVYRTYDMHSMVRQVHWHPGSNLLPIGCNDHVQILNMHRGQLTKIAGIKTGARALAYPSP